MHSLDCDFFRIYEIQRTNIRKKIKKSLKIQQEKIVKINCCVLTEGNKDRKKIEQIKLNFKNIPPIKLFNWGEAYLVLDGHHRITALHELGINKIKALVSVY